MRSISARTTAALAAATILPLAIAGCGQDPAAQAEAGTDTIQAVTSTNVYGNIVETIGGEHVEVTAIVNSLSQDPHSYEATVQDKLAVSKADLVVENGGGYDQFLHGLADDVNLDHEYIVSVVDIAGVAPGDEHAEGGHSEEGHAGEEHAGEGHAEEGHAEEGHAEEGHAEEGHAEEGHDHGSFNEHVWYKLDAISELAAVIEEKLSALDPDNAASYESNARAFTDELAALIERAESLHEVTHGSTVAVTEPVPAYLLEAVGLENVTPAGYIEAIEEDADVPVAALNEIQTMVKSGSVAFLAYNEQTEGPQTQSVRQAADAASVPVVNFTETLPEGEDFISWMTGNLDRIEEALNS